MLLVALAALVSCASSAPPAASEVIIGRWTGTDARDVSQTFTFRPDGTLTWDLVGPNFSGTFELLYLIHDEPSPHLLDIGVFEDGPIAGQSLFGILEFVGPAEFRLDLEAGPVGVAPGDPAGNDERPTEFSDQAVLYRRISQTTDEDDVASVEITNPNW